MSNVDVITVTGRLAFPEPLTRSPRSSVVLEILTYVEGENPDVRDGEDAGKPIRKEIDGRIRINFPTKGLRARLDMEEAYADKFGKTIQMQIVRGEEYYSKKDKCHYDNLDVVMEPNMPFSATMIETDEITPVPAYMLGEHNIL